LAAHHGAATDPDNFADFELFKHGFRVFVVAGTATAKDSQYKQQDQSFSHRVLGSWWLSKAASDP